jgi:diguanylate cyclase (GGDEF)-like protein
MLSPFAILNLANGNYVIGSGVSLVVLFFALVILRQKSRGFFDANFFLLLLVPFVIVFIAMATVEVGIQAVLWCYPTILMYYFLLPQRYAWIANGVLIIVFVPLAIQTFPAALAYRVVVTLVLVSILPAAFVNVIERLQNKLKALATRDSLTGLYNRALLAESLNYAIEERKRLNIPMTLAVFDVDHFKAINDQLGHDGGDRVLKDIATVLTNRSRSVDKVFRLGGEEFLVLLHSTAGNDGFNVAEEIRRTVASLKKDFPVTVSGGLAGLRDDDDYSAWMKRADIHLYQAKALGRNRIESDAKNQ